MINSLRRLTIYPIGSTDEIPKKPYAIIRFHWILTVIALRSLTLLIIIISHNCYAISRDLPSPCSGFPDFRTLKRRMANFVRSMVNSVISPFEFLAQFLTHLGAFTILLVNAIRVRIFSTAESFGNYYTHITVSQIIFFFSRSLKMQKDSSVIFSDTTVYLAYFSLEQNTICCKRTVWPSFQTSFKRMSWGSVTRSSRFFTHQSHRRAPWVCVEI